MSIGATGPKGLTGAIGPTGTSNINLLYDPLAHYVSTFGGSDTDFEIGNANKPFKTITKALESVSDIYSLIIFPGLYAEDIITPNILNGRIYAIGNVEVLGTIIINGTVRIEGIKCTFIDIRGVNCYIHRCIPSTILVTNSLNCTICNCVSTETVGIENSTNVLIKDSTFNLDSDVYIHTIESTCILKNNLIYNTGLILATLFDVDLASKVVSNDTFLFTYTPLMITVGDIGLNSINLICTDTTNRMTVTGAINSMNLIGFDPIDSYFSGNIDSFKHPSALILETQLIDITDTIIEDKVGLVIIDSNDDPINVSLPPDPLDGRQIEISLPTGNLNLSPSSTQTLLIDGSSSMLYSGSGPLGIYLQYIGATDQWLTVIDSL